MSETRATLEERLEAAERLCWVYGWCATHADESPRDKAAYALWRRWHALTTPQEQRAAIKAMPDDLLEEIASEVAS